MYSEGFIDFNGYKTWYSVYGDLTAGITPLVCIHGGPGYPHNHLQNLSELAKQGIPVVLYDQLGCGKSDRPDDPSLWTIELFINELQAVRDALGLDKINLLGHSWGGTLAAEYMFTNPTGVEKLILSSPLLDSDLWVSEANRLMDEMPAWAARVMRKHEAAGTTDDPEYADAYIEFRKLFLCRAEPYPKLLRECDEAMGAQVYATMWGPSEACVTGTLKNWTAFDRLHSITIPTLLLSGRYDEATPPQMDRTQAELPQAERVTFEHSAHVSNLEEPELYLQTLADFLAT